jgi:hypothetical protein
MVLTRDPKALCMKPSDSWPCRACRGHWRGFSLLSPFRSLLLGAVASAFILVPPLRAQTADRLQGYVTEAAQRFAIPQQWIRSVMRVESANNPRAVSSMGAMGLMQIMPTTWRDLRNRHGLGSDPFEPRDNILAGAAYLSEMHGRYGSVALMLAAYNAGPARADAHHATGRALPAETQAYVARLMPMVGSDAVFTAPPMAPVDPRVAPLFVQVSAVQLVTARPSAGTSTTALTADEAQFLALQSRTTTGAVRTVPPQPHDTMVAAQPTSERRSALLSFPATSDATPRSHDRLFAVMRSPGRSP